MQCAAVAGNIPRILINVDSTEGFGHFNIVSMLNDALQAYGAEVHIFSSTLHHASSRFDFRNAHVHKLPEVFWKEIDGRRTYLTADGTLLHRDKLYRTNLQAATRHIITTVRPHAFIMEHYPFMMQWRDPVLKAMVDVYGKRAAAGATRPPSISLCRDIVFSSDPLRTIGILRHHFDYILVRGDRRLATLADSAPDWKKITVATEYMGQFVEELPARDDMPEDKRAVIAFAGGGFFPEDIPFFEAVIRARQHSLYKGNRLHIYVSDNVPEDLFIHFDTIAASEPDAGNIRISRSVAPVAFRKEIVNCAAAICRGGYNTTAELMKARRPFVLIPRASAEQQKRASLLNRLLNVPIIQAADLVRPVILANALAHARMAANDQPADINRNGAGCTAKRIVELAEQYAKTNALQGTPYCQ